MPIASLASAMSMVSLNQNEVRSRALHRARLLNRFTLWRNAAERIVAILAGIAAGSVSLVGFGLDSAIEVSASVILAWRLRQERHGGCMERSDRRATRGVAVSFAVLALYVGRSTGVRRRLPPALGLCGRRVVAEQLAALVRGDSDRSWPHWTAPAESHRSTSPPGRR
ncbi:MAG: hypothetical protein ACRDV9_14180 [Acidimicrobiia bacterium]